MVGPALGLIETKGIGGALQATKAASNTGQVVIVSAEQSNSDRMTVKIEGDWDAVQAAVEAGARAAYEAGEFIALHVIPRTDNGVIPILPYRQFVAKYNPDLEPTKPVAPRTRPRPKPTSAPAPRSAPEPLSARVESPKPAPPPTTPVAVAPSKPKPRPEPPASKGELLPMSELEKMPVVKLRRYARSVPGLPIQGRQISKANKQQLLEALGSMAAERDEPFADNGGIFE